VFGPLAREHVADTCAPRRIGRLASAGLRAELSGEEGAGDLLSVEDAASRWRFYRKTQRSRPFQIAKLALLTHYGKLLRTSSPSVCKFHGRAREINPRAFLLPVGFTLTRDRRREICVTCLRHMLSITFATARGA